MTFRLANINDRAALVEGENYYDLETISDGEFSTDVMDAIGKGDWLSILSDSLDNFKPTGTLGEDSAEVGCPVPNPRNSFAIGLNYVDHSAESKMDLPENPLVFTKFPSCLVGPTDNVELRSEACDYEGELVVIIGTEGKDIAARDAWSHVAGFTIGQDISDRAMQFAAKPPHFDLGKSFDTFGPMGPVLVSLDSFENPASHHIVTKINGETRQDGNSDAMVFDIPTLIAYLSRVTTLSVGDVIFTGTPAGIGATQGKFLADGDVITTTIEGIGTMTNACVRVSDHAPS